jgi:hypothetical protein
MGQTRRATGRALLLALGLALGGCDDESGGGTDGGLDARDGAPTGDVAADTGDVTQGPADGLADAVVQDAPGSDGGPIAPPRKLDLIMVIDNSVSMEEEQDSLKRSFPRLISRLAALPGGLPDLRIAVLSSNFGAGSAHPALECSNFGDRGSFLARPACGLAGGALWLSVDALGNKNFPGELVTTFSCLASLGTGGCGYEHHLQSLRASLNSNVAPQNAGFLRDDARLGIVILADEDDCSAGPDATFFAEVIAGQAGSLRCALRGHTCNGQPVTATAGFSAPLAACQPVMHANTPQDGRDRLINVSNVVQDIKAVKDLREDRILVSAIIGWDPSPGATYAIEMGMGVSGPQLDLKPACTNVNPGAGSAAPGIRLQAFARSFLRHTVHSICADLDPAMTDIGNALAGMMAAP